MNWSINEFECGTLSCSPSISDFDILFRKHLMCKVTYDFSFYSEDCFDRDVILFNLSITKKYPKEFERKFRWIEIFNNYKSSDGLPSEKAIQILPGQRQPW